MLNMHPKQSQRNWKVSRKWRRHCFSGSHEPMNVSVERRDTKVALGRGGYESPACGSNW